MPISRMQQPRQMYGLGSLVKSIGKTVKKIVKSPVAKVAMLGFGANALMPGGLSSLFSGGGGLTGILSKGKDLIGGLSTAKKITGALALGGAFAGMEDQQVEELKRNPEALRSYLSQYYRNLNQNASDEEVNRFVEANMTEYKADGGRIGYREGSLANYPRPLANYPRPMPTPQQGGLEPTPGRTLGGGNSLYKGPMKTQEQFGANARFTSQQSFDDAYKNYQQSYKDYRLNNNLELAYDATNTDIYGSSAASFTPKTIMNQSGNQVQAGFGKIPGMQPRPGLPGPFTGPPTQTGGLTLNPNLQQPQANVPFMGRPAIPDISNRPATLPSQPLLAANSNNLYDQFRSIEERRQIAEDMNNAPTGLMRNDGTRANVTYENISDGRNTMPSMPGNNMSFPRAMPATPVPFQAQKMPFAQQTNSSSPIAQIAGMANGGRIGYNEGTPEMGMIDPNKAKQAKQMIGMGADQDLISTITGLTKEQVEFLMREDKAYGGRMGFAMGNPEENAIQASGIMNLPLNKNPAGITELDLRETGGFIPPVGVKEKADDIPAMLSNNEFVFTADAVRGMGDGNVNKGAQRMYDMMKKLEKGGRV
jgi:hypothetical protein